LNGLFYLAFPSFCGLIGDASSWAAENACIKVVQSDPSLAVVPRVAPFSKSLEFVITARSLGILPDVLKSGLPEPLLPPSAGISVVTD